jgi:hypothetical protein
METGTKPTRIRGGICHTGAICARKITRFWHLTRKSPFSPAEHHFRDLISVKRLILSACAPIPAYSGLPPVPRPIRHTLDEGKPRSFLVYPALSGLIRIKLFSRQSPCLPKTKITKRTHFVSHTYSCLSTVCAYYRLFGNQKRTHFQACCRHPARSSRVVRSQNKPIFHGESGAADFRPPTPPVALTRNKMKIYFPKTAENLLLERKRRIITSKAISNEMIL